MTFKVGFIGIGKMGGAILNGIINTSVIDAKNICAFNRSEKGKTVIKESGASIAASAKDVANQSDIIILAVKPKDSLQAIKELGASLNGKALISIVAGLDYKTIYNALRDVNARVLVILPNTPVLAGAGTTIFTTETTFTSEEKTFAVRLFSSVGIVEWIEEKLLFAASAVGGSGPAYTAMFIEALADAAVLEGIPRATAYRIAAQTVAGTGRLILETGLHPGIIKDDVCSAGGTSIEGVKALEQGGLRAAVINAVAAASAKFFKLVK